MHVIKVKCNKKSIKKEKTSTTSRSFYVFFNLLLELTDSIRIAKNIAAFFSKVNEGRGDPDSIDSSVSETKLLN